MVLLRSILGVKGGIGWIIESDAVEEEALARDVLMLIFAFFFFIR